MSEKVFKEFIARLEEAAKNYEIHKSNIWLKQLESSRDALLNIFNKQQEEIEQSKKDKRAFGNIISIDVKKAEKDNPFFSGYSGIKKYFNI